MNKKENSRTKLVQTASRLFQTQGYHGTGLNQITKESGAPKGSLYYYFPNGKEQLAIEAVHLTAAKVTDRIERGLEKQEDPIKAIQHLINDLADQAVKDGETSGVPVAAVALETTYASEPIRQACHAAYEQFQQAFTRKLKDKGYAEKRAEELGVLINSMIEGAFLVSFTTKSKFPLRLVADQIPMLLK
ncbi:TetR/AcrR family transcriptional regulator [Halobacillus sp. B29]|uniref:TetR/AcrR family transcriptional regulator n=1 Tax=Halobacillus sp. B29 TaxID=3457432 RepID=UPI003FCE1A88